MPVEHSSGDERIRVLVADNTHIHTQLLADALRRDRRLEVISSGTGDLIETAAKNRIQVAVIGCNLEEDPLRGLEVVRELRTALPEARAVVLMGSAKRETVVEAFRAGARGIFSKNESVETLSKCVRNVHEGQIWASNEQMAFAVEALAASPNVRAVSANGLDLLSKREMDVVRCLADGLTNREIAERLGLSQHTIKNYLFRVFDKLGVSSRMELLFLTLMQPGAPQSVPPSRLGGGRRNGHAQSAGVEMAVLHKAAEEGLPTAQIELARMHAEGRGIAKDAVAAYMWYVISERRSSELRDEVTSAKRKLAGILTAEQMVEAQRRADEKLKHLPKPAPLSAAAPAPSRLSL